MNGWIHTKLKLTIDQIIAIQLSGEENAIFVKLVSKTLLEKTLLAHQGQTTIEYEDGSVETITLKNAEDTEMLVRVFNVPLEVKNDEIRRVLSAYGQVKNIQNEKWSARYRFQAYNGIRQVSMEVKQPIPSYIRIGETRAQIQYLGQTRTCSICNENTHLRQDCLLTSSTLPIRRSNWSRPTWTNDNKQHQQSNESQAIETRKQEEGHTTHLQDVNKQPESAMQQQRHAEVTQSTDNTPPYDTQDQQQHVEGDPPLEQQQRTAQKNSSQDNVTPTHHEQTQNATTKIVTQQTQQHEQEESPRCEAQQNTRQQQNITQQVNKQHIPDADSKTGQGVAGGPQESCLSQHMTEDDISRSDYTTDMDCDDTTRKRQIDDEESPTNYAMTRSDSNALKVKIKRKKCKKTITRKKGRGNSD